MRNAAGLPQGGATFKPVRLGAGGFVTGISISTDAVTQVCRTDVFGAHVKTAGGTIWQQVFNSTSLAVGDAPGTAGYVSPNGSLTDGNGCYEIVVAPNDNQRLYAVWNTRLWKSINAGTNWTHLTGVADFLSLANSGPQPHNNGPNMVVDPQNHDVFLLGTQANGLYWSTNGGTTISNVALGTNATFGGWQVPSKVACDPTGAIVSTVKQRWFAALQGTGIYVSTTGPGGTYTLMTGSPTYASDIVFDASGNCWALDLSNTTTSNLWMCAAGGVSWVHSPGSAPFASGPGVTIAVDPKTSGASVRVVVLSDGAYAIVSNNTGTSWLGGGPYFVAYPCNPTIVLHPYTVPWLGTGPGSFNTGMARFDPVTSNKLWSTSGVGTYSCFPPSVFDVTTASQFNWIECSEGIENMDATSVVEPVGGAPLFGVWDRATWRMPDLDHSPHSPNLAIPGAFTNGVQATWDIAIAADNPQWIVSLTNFSGQVTGYSTDGWKTVLAFPTSPPNHGNGGSLAVGLAGNVIVLPSSNGQPYYTKDGGNTWPALAVPGVPATGETGFGFADYNLTKYATYDAGAAAFYIYNYGPASNTSIAGVWKSTNQGDTWTHVFTGNLVGIGDGYRSKIRAVPGNSGHLFFCDGAVSTGNLMRSTNGGVTWTAVSGVTSCADYAFGKSAPGQSYPAVYFYATVGAVAGLYRSDDNFATTPKLLSTFPGTVIDGIQCVGASPNTYGTCYVGFPGSSFVYGKYAFALTLS